MATHIATPGSLHCQKCLTHLPVIDRIGDFAECSGDRFIARERMDNVQTPELIAMLSARRTSPPQPADYVRWNTELQYSDYTMRFYQGAGNG